MQEGVYEIDRGWSDLFIPEIKRIVGPHLLCEAPLEVDRKQAADLITLHARDLTIACRVRRPDYLDEYGEEFTIRSHRDSGAETELNKIINGWGDWMFYGIAKSLKHTDGFARWKLLDLKAWRGHIIRHFQNRITILEGKKANQSCLLKMGEKTNKKDGTRFVYFDIRSFPPKPALVLASSDSSQVEQAEKELISLANGQAS